jgi:hypothetical protein
MGIAARSSGVEGNESQPQWIVAPLLGAGLDLDEVRTLLFRVSFECLVTRGRLDVWDVSAFLDQHPAAVRAAWIETVDRMLRAGDDAIAP